MKIALCLSLLIFTLTTYADSEAYNLPITRNQVTHEMLAYPFWSGEYPSPVIDVKTKKIHGYLSLRDLREKKTCTVIPGVYHPWSEDKTSILSFYSITEKEDLLLLKDMPDIDAKKGDKLKNTIYLSEGMCLYELKNQYTQTTCLYPEAAQPIEYPSHPSE